MIRRAFVWLHRWFGLGMAVFLIIEGFSGCLLAFNAEVTRLLNPKLFVSRPSPDAKPLDLAALAEKAESVGPDVRVAYYARYRDDQVILRCFGRKDPATNKERELGFMYLVVDPYTGKELGRLLWRGYDVNGGFLANVIPFLYDLHTTLKLSSTGEWILSLVALIWSIDCFVGFYLTLPVSRRSFLRRWKTSWLVKWRSGRFRLNFDLHRAGGLWFWLALFVFAWSSTHLIDRFGVYERVMGTVFAAPSVGEEVSKFFPNRHVDIPKLGWREAQSAGEKLMAEQAKAQGFKILRPVSLNFLGYGGLYNYIVETDRGFPADKRETVFFDADTGDFHGLMPTRKEILGSTITSWLFSLHMIQDPVDYVTYRILVSATGVAIVILSVTGVYIWWKKRRARGFSRSSRGHLAERPSLAAAETGGPKS